MAEPQDLPPDTGAPTVQLPPHRSSADRIGARVTDALDLETITAWVRDNQTPAMLGAFAIGVFFGVLMRR